MQINYNNTIKRPLHNPNTDFMVTIGNYLSSAYIASSEFYKNHEETVEMIATITAVTAIALVAFTQYDQILNAIGFCVDSFFDTTFTLIAEYKFQTVVLISICAIIHELLDQNDRIMKLEESANNPFLNTRERLIELKNAPKTHPVSFSNEDFLVEGEGG